MLSRPVSPCVIRNSCLRYCLITTGARPRREVSGVVQQELPGGDVFDPVKKDGYAETKLNESTLTQKCDGPQ